MMASVTGTACLRAFAAGEYAWKWMSAYLSISGEPKRTPFSGYSSMQAFQYILRSFTTGLF